MDAREVRMAAESFGLKALPEPDKHTPKVNEQYAFRKGMLTEMVGFWLLGETAMKLVGHKGCGKTTVVEQFHAAMNYPLIKVTCNPRMEAAQLRGQFAPVQGGFSFTHGALVRAAKAGVSILLDEYNLLDPGEAAGINDLLEGGMMEVPETGEVIHPAPGFRIFACCNPNDQAMGYFGRNEQDSSNDDRFWTITVDYPSAEEETPLVQSVLEQTFDTTVAAAFAEKMVQVANKIRQQFMGVSSDGNALEITMSTRTLLRWAKGFTVFHEAPQPVHFALARAFTNQKPFSETKTAIHAIVTDIFGE